MRLVYLGTPADAVPPLRALVDAGHDVALVVTQPDAAGRAGEGSDPSPVQQAADELGPAGAHAVKAREIVDDVRASRAPSSAWSSRSGSCCRSPLLEALPLGFVNVHFSLLPRWRGAAPVERAMLAGDERDRRLPDAARSRPRHRPGVRARRASPIDTARDRGRAPRPPGRRRHAAARRAAPDVATASRDAAGRRADVRRQAHGRRVPRSIPRVRRPSSIASCAPAIPRPGAWMRVRRAAGEGVAGATTATERAHALGVDHGAAACSAPPTARSQLDEVQPEGKRRMARARGGAAARTISRSTRASTSSSAPPAGRSTRSSAIDDGAFAHILVPELLAPSTSSTPRDRGVRHRARLRHGPHAARARLSCSPRCRQRPLDDRSNPTCAPRSGSARTSCSSGCPPHAAVGRDGRALVARTGARLRQRRAARAARARARRGRGPQGDSVIAASACARRIPTGSSDLSSTSSAQADALATLALDNEPPPVTLRVNPMRDDGRRRRARAARRRRRRRARGALVPDALLVRATPATSARSTLVRDGRVTPQDQASQAVVAALDPQPGERVLDVAAAPGGKAVAAAERMRDDGLVVAADVHPARVRAARTRAGRRLGLACGRAGRRRRSPSRRCATQSFDRVLLDAPCSGLGVLRRRPDARWRVPPSDVARARRAAAGAARRARRDAVRPGGRLVYSVCTLTRMETVGVDEFAASELPTSPRSTRRRRRGAAHGRGALLVAVRRRAPTACSSSCSSAPEHRERPELDLASARCSRPVLVGVRSGSAPAGLLRRG